MTLMTLGADILHIIEVDHFNVKGRYITHYHFNDIRGRYITYYWGWITLMTLGADISHIIEVESL